MPKNVVIIGASGSIGSALTRLYSDENSTRVFAFSRKKTNISLPNVVEDHIDLVNEDSISVVASKYFGEVEIDSLIIASGALHTKDFFPEKSLRDISVEKFQTIFAINSIGPALIFKHFNKFLSRDRPGILAAISARVGSISDNQLGGWYSYRASKAALNMIIKNTSIEVRRRCPKAIVVGLHPGTVNSKLSEPFQSNVPTEKLFTSQYAANKLKNVLDALNIDDNGKCWDFNGSLILP